MTLDTKDFVLETRQCAACSAKFRVLPTDRQKYCSIDCIIKDNNLTGKEKLHLRSWTKCNPDKLKTKQWLT